MIDATRTGREGAPQQPGRLGERLRQLRIGAGLTQTELAGARFSKEYVSQIERGKTRPTRETIEWLARRLEVDPEFLANGQPRGAFLAPVAKRLEVENPLFRCLLLNSPSESERKSRDHEQNRRRDQEGD